MDRDYVESSMIASIGHDSNSNTLEIEFKKNGQVWQYFDFPEYSYHEFKSSSSLGKHFLASIKGKYSESRM
jgi:hypothetical protein